MTPIAPDPTHLEAWNEEMAERYDPEIYYSRASGLIRFVEGRRMRQIMLLIAAQPGERILEVGCGAGHILASLPAGELYGIDLSTSMVTKAQARLGTRADIRKGDALALPYADNSFDKIICSEVLEHVPEPGTALREIARVLKPGGIAVVTVPNEALVNRLKAILRKLKLFDLLLRRKEGYQAPERMDDEWHLHAFSLRLLMEFVQAPLTRDRVVAVPWPMLPIRYVVRFRVSK